MVCLQETAFGQRRDVPRKEHRQDAAACVSLSKSTMSKTRTGLPAHRLAPGVGGGGYLVASVFSVNRLFRAFFSPPGDPVLKSVSPQLRLH
jgi:hypothetical protein